MALNTTATLSVDTVFQQQDTETNSFDNRQGSLGYSQALTSGTGSLNIDAVYNLQSYSIPSGSQLSIDFLVCESAYCWWINNPILSII